MHVQEHWIGAFAQAWCRLGDVLFGHSRLGIVDPSGADDAAAGECTQGNKFALVLRRKGDAGCTEHQPVQIAAAVDDDVQIVVAIDFQNLEPEHGCLVQQG